ncbi:MAG: DUF3105 domain-containing protein [Leptospirales bacterium]
MATVTPSKKTSLFTKWPLFLVLAILATFFIYIGHQKKGDTSLMEATSTPPASSAPTAQASDGDHPGIFYPSQGHDHWDATHLQGFKYNSNPPTSGPHMEQFIDSYFPTSPLPAYIQVHLLEHGNILIQYNCTCPKTLTALQKIAGSFDTYSPSLGLEEGKGVIVAPNPGIPKKIVLSAWTRLLPMDTADDAAIRKFITVWLGNNQNTHQ